MVQASGHKKARRLLWNVPKVHSIELPMGPWLGWHMPTLRLTCGPLQVGLAVVRMM